MCCDRCRSVIKHWVSSLLYKNGSIINMLLIIFISFVTDRLIHNNVGWCTADEMKEKCFSVHVNKNYVFSRLFACLQIVAYGTSIALHMWIHRVWDTYIGVAWSMHIFVHYTLNTQTSGKKQYKQKPKFTRRNKKE